MECSILTVSNDQMYYSSYCEKRSDMLTSKYVETNQQKIVEVGGLSSLLMLLRNTEDETIHRVAAGAIANLAMNGQFVFLVGPLIPLAYLLF